MGIRDVIMVVLGYGCVPLALYNAYYGLMAYCWLSFMRPQSLVWSPTVQSARITFAVGISLIARAVFSDGPRLRLRGPTIAFLALWAWFGISTLTSTHMDLSTDPFIQFCKVGVAVVLITGLVRTRSQLKWLIILLALCPGMWAAKFGQFFVRTGGGMSLRGGPIGMDNNDTALFIAMSIPMLVFAAGEVKKKWGRWVLYAAAGLAVPGVILTGSRGGMLAMAAALALTVWRKTKWWKALIAGAVVSVAVLAIIPGQTEHRYQTIESYEEDISAMRRILAWQTSLAMAEDRPAVGVGFGMGTYMAEYDKYKTRLDDYPHAAHSVWFATLGQTGYVGLGLYLTLIATVFWATRRVRRLSTDAKGNKGAWAKNYAAMLECTMLTFIVGATFLSKLEFEYIYAICMVSVPLLHIATEEASRRGGKKTGVVQVSPAASVM